MTKFRKKESIENDHRLWVGLGDTTAINRPAHTHTHMGGPNNQPTSIFIQQAAYHGRVGTSDHPIIYGAFPESRQEADKETAIIL